MVVLLPEKMQPYERLSAAATSISGARAVVHKGTFSSGSESLQGELKVTKAARAAGQVNWDGENLTLLSADNKLFVKAPAAYLEKSLPADPGELLEDGEHWGRLETSKLGLDVRRDFTPSGLATALRQAAALKEQLTETESTARGQRALKISTPTATFYVSESDKPELLRYERSFPKIQVDVTAQDSGTGAATLAEMRTLMGELKDSVNTQGSLEFKKLEKGKCYSNSDSCAVRVQFEPEIESDTPVEVRVRLWLTAGSFFGKHLGSCRTSLKATSKTGSTWVSCTVRDKRWSKFSRGSERGYFTQHEYVVAGVAEGEIEKMQSGLDTE